MIRFDQTKETERLTLAIIDRLASIELPDADDDDEPTTADLLMDFSALKASYPRCDLSLLLQSSEFDFIHDVYGIWRHLDRDNSSPTGGRLLHCFYPRFMRTSALDVQTFGRGKRIDPAKLSDAELDRMKGTSEVATTEWLRRHPEAEASDGGRLG